MRESPERVGDLEIQQDLTIQQRTWRVQRIGWWLILLLVLAGIAGLFGRGPLASSTAGAEGGPLRIDYDRLARHRAATELVLHLAPGAAPDGTARIWIDGDYIRGLQIQGIRPEPQSVEAAPDGYIYSFPVSDPSSPSSVIFEVEPDVYWSRMARIGLVGRPPLRFTQFVFP